MLVLRRNLRQRIITVRGERIAIDLVAVGPNWARIGVEAARELLAKIVTTSFARLPGDAS